MMKPKIYLAGPISGKSFEEVMNRYNEKIAILTDFGYTVLSPMTGKQHFQGTQSFDSHGDDNPISTNHAIFERDQWMVTQADVVLVDLSNAPERVSIGSMFELAWASLLHKHTVVIMKHDPLNHNIHNHAFVLEAADIILPDLQAAYDYLRTLALGDLPFRLGGIDGG